MFVPPSSIAPGSNMIVPVNVLFATPGEKTGTLTITSSNAADYVINFTATAVSPPTGGRGIFKKIIGSEIFLIET